MSAIRGEGPEVQYTLGLGSLKQLSPGKGKKLSKTQEEELMFIKREKEREEEIKAIEEKAKKPLNERTTYGKPDRQGAIRKLYDAAVNYGNEDKGLHHAILIRYSGTD